MAQMVNNSGGDGTAVDFHSLPAHAYGDADTMNTGVPGGARCHRAAGRVCGAWRVARGLSAGAGCGGAALTVLACGVACAGSVVASMLDKGLSDSTWIFSHWEGVLAERSG